MQALVIVGHESSDYAFVEELLYKQGMEQAKPSRRELLTPIDIGEKLLQTQTLEFASLRHFEQLEAGEIWNELALDLLLANVEQAFWGWSDPQTIVLLDYWRKVEPQLKFLLLYDKPEVIFSRIFNKKQINQEDLEAAICYWNDFYEEILTFYHRHQDNCLLVHIGAIRDDKHLLGQAIAEFIPHTQENKSYMTNADVDFSVNETSLLLMTAILKEKEYASLSTSYESLQAVADIPLTVVEALTTERIMSVWNHYQQPAELPEQAEKTKELEEENELLLLQLHQVQEELEHYFLENQQLKTGDSSPTTLSSLSSYGSSSFHYGAADRIKRQLSYRLGATMIQQSRTLKGCLMMPWALIKEDRAFRKDLKARSHEKLPPIAEYQDAYEAERVKQHLSYRLGHVLVKNTNSVTGWFKLPWLLRQEIVDFQRRRGY